MFDPYSHSPCHITIVSKTRELLTDLYACLSSIISVPHYLRACAAKISIDRIPEKLNPSGME